MKLREVLFLVLMITSLSACVVLKPENPQLEADVAPEQTQVSTLNLPIKVNLKQLATMINEKIPTSLFVQSGIDVGHGITLQLDVQRSGNISLSTASGKVNTTVPLYIKGRVDWNTSIFGAKIGHHEDFDAKIIVYTSTMIKVDNNWNLTSETSTNFDLTQAPAIEVMGIKLTFGSLTRESLKKQLPEINGIIDEQIKGLYNLKANAENYWELLRQPFLLSDTPIKIWGLFDPISFNFAPPRSIDNSTLEFNLGLNTRIQTYIGNNPPAPSIGDLVPVKNEVSYRKDFTVNVPATIEISALEKAARDMLVNNTFAIPGTHRTVLIRDLNMYGAGKYMVFKVDIKSNKTTGTIFLISELDYNPQTNVLSLKNMTFDVSTNQMLLNKAAWLTNKLFLAEIEKKLKYNTSDMLEKARNDADSAINNLKLAPNLSVKCKIEGLSIRSVSTEDKYVKIVTNVTGSLGVELK